MALGHRRLKLTLEKNQAESFCVRQVYFTKSCQQIYNHGKSLGTLLRFWSVSQFTQVGPLPSPQKQCWAHVSRIFSEFQLCIGWGEGELEENFENDALF